jgi:hypothetical protein
MVQSNSPLVKTIAPQGPINPINMFEAGKELIESVTKLLASFGGDPGNVQKTDKAIRLASRGRRVRMADAQSARQHRHVRHAARKGHKAKPVRVAAVAGERGTRQATHRHGGRGARG